MGNVIFLTMLNGQPYWLEEKKDCSASTFLVGDRAMLHEEKQMIRTASYKTLGCKLNQAETDAIRVKLESLGITSKPFGESVDLTVVNTCCVTNEADGKSRNAIRQAIRHSQNGRIVVTGCYAQISPEQIQAIDGVDLVLGSDEKFRISDHLQKIEVGKLEAPLAFVNAKGDLETVTDAGFMAATTRTRAFLKIQDGCNYYCTYCIIPFARGRARSRGFQETVDEAKRLVDNGYQEVTVTGVNIGTYQSPDSMQRDFVQLMEALERVEGLKRIRISSIEPNTVSRSLLELIRDSKVFCPHMHIPLQSGSAAILKGMKRHYSLRDFDHLMVQFQELLPQASLGTDVIVGFPGETEDHFQETIDYLEQHPFTYLHVFRFSARSGTFAARLKDPVTKQTAQNRSRILQELSRKMRSRFAASFIGSKQPVLFEEQDENGFYCGLTPHYLRVRVASEQLLQNQILPVELHHYNGRDFEGAL